MILAYTEHVFGLAPLCVNDAQAYGYTNAFNYSQTPRSPPHMVDRPLPAWAKHIRLNPGAGKRPDLAGSWGASAAEAP
ncbi:MAG TPA: hypothetical protein VGI74_09560 [Streptosporangiaceae bacterium]